MAARRQDLEASFLSSRQRWVRLEAVTAYMIRNSYQRATAALAQRIARIRGPVTQAHLQNVQNDLQVTQALLTTETLANIQRGVMDAAAQSATEAITGQLDLGPLVGTAAIRARMQGVAQAEAVAFLGRILNDGLNLSDRIWASGGYLTTAVGQLVQNAIITGQSARELARDLNEHVAPGARTPTRIETARNMGISTDVSAAAIRLARTEINAAAREATVMTNRTNPFYRGVRWVISERIAARSLPVCVICHGLARGGPQGDGVYPRGEEPAPTASHPNCRCFLEPIYDDLDTIETRLGDWIENPDDEPAIQEWADWMRNPNPQALPPSVEPRQAPLPGFTAAALVAEIPWAEWTNVSQAEIAARQRYPHIAWDFSDADISNINPSMQRFAELSDRFPEVTARLRFVGTDDGEGDAFWNAHPNTRAFAMRDGTRIALNPAYYGGPKLLESLQRDVREGWKPKGHDRVDSTMVHEFGHMVFNWLLAEVKTNPDRAVVDVVDVNGIGLFGETLSNWWNAHYNKATKALSGYGASNPDEAWADAFAASVLPTPGINRVKYVREFKALLGALDRSNWREKGAYQWLNELAGDAHTRAVAALADFRKALGLQDRFWKHARAPNGGLPITGPERAADIAGVPAGAQRLELPRPLSERQRSARDWIGDQSSVRVIASAEERQLLTRMVGRELSDLQIAQLANAPAGTDILIQRTALGDVQLIANTSGGAPVERRMGSTRTLSRGTDGTLELTNDWFSLNDAAPGGTGTRLAAIQLAQAQELGIDRVRMEAAGGPDAGLNGYYTWPRAGFDTEPLFYADDPDMPSAVSKVLRDGGAPSLEAADRGVDGWSILDILATPEGRKAWRDEGFGVQAHFEVKDGRSRNWQVLNAYLDEIGYGRELNLAAEITATDPAGFLRGHQDTQQLFQTAGGGRYPAERLELQNRLYVTPTVESVPPRASGPTTVYAMGGGPAAGKSTVLNTGQASVPDQQRAVWTNADDAKAVLPEYKKMVEVGYLEAAARVHEESSDMNKRVISEALGSRRDVVVDGVLDGSLDKVRKKVDGWRREGAEEVHAVYVTIPPEMAVERAAARAARSGRMVPEHIIRGDHQGVARMLPQALEARVFDTLELYDNSGPQGSTPTLLVSQDRSGRVTIHDQIGYDAFLARGG